MLWNLVLGVLTVIIGPFAGLGLCKVLGASNGFLSLSTGVRSPVHMTIEAVVYAAIAVAVFFCHNYDTDLSCHQKQLLLSISSQKPKKKARSVGKRSALILSLWAVQLAGFIITTKLRGKACCRGCNRHHRNSKPYNVRGFHCLYTWPWSVSYKDISLYNKASRKNRQKSVVACTVCFTD